MSSPTTPRGVSPERRDTLLLVDDERQVCEGLRRILHRDGYVILMADGPAAAMRVLAERQVNVVISDQRMPHKTGTQFLSEVSELYPKTVRMILSGEADIDDVARAMHSGVIYKFLTKPIDPALLRANVSEAFARVATLHSDTSADRDPVTQLPNRGGVDRLYEGTRSRAAETGERICLLMIEVDQYDSVVSSFGQAAAERFERAVAAELQRALRGRYTFGRDSPGVLLLLTHSEYPVDRVTRIHDVLEKTFAEPVRIDGRGVSVTLSIGVAVSDGRGAFGQLVDEARAAMTTGRERGGATIELYQPGLVNELRGQLALESDLRQAVATGAFELHYQPQVSRGSGAIIGLEALLRWPHAEKGMVSPGTFIPLAERLDLIPQIGEWVIERAVAQFAAWRAAGRAPQELAVNVSALQMRDRSLVKKVDQLLRKHDLAPDRLVLEITESATISDQAHISDCLRGLSELGVTLAIDDFGTGYANVGNLARFPFKQLKIDRSLLQQTATERGRIVYMNVVRMMRELGLVTVAEGVETGRELAIVHTAGCDIVQGYFYSPPLSPARLDELLGARKPFQARRAS